MLQLTESPEGLAGCPEWSPASGGGGRWGRVEIESDILHDAAVMYSQSSRCATDVIKNQCLNPVTESGGSRGRSGRSNKVTSVQKVQLHLKRRPSADPDPFLVHGLVVGNSCPRETLSRFIPWKCSLKCISSRRVCWREHPRGHFITLYLPQGHQRGHICCILFKHGAPGG